MVVSSIRVHRTVGAVRERERERESLLLIDAGKICHFEKSTEIKNEYHNIE